MQLQVSVPTDLSQTILWLFIAVVGFVLLSLLVSARRPVTNEGEIGDYSFYAANDPEEFYGITSPATSRMQSIDTLVNMETVKDIAVKSGNVVSLLKSFHWYGLRSGTMADRARKGWGKILILSTEELTDPRYYQQSERRWRWIPPGYISMRRVVCHMIRLGEAEGWTVFGVDPIQARGEGKEVESEAVRLMREIQPQQVADLAVNIRVAAQKSEKESVWKALYADSDKSLKAVTMLAREERNKRSAAEGFAARVPIGGGPDTGVTQIMRPTDILKGVGLAIAGSAVGGNLFPKLTTQIDPLSGSILGIMVVGAVFWWLNR